MKFNKMLMCADVYTLGVVYRIVTGGIPNIHGSTMREKMDYVENALGDSLKDFLVRGPADDPAQVAGLITEPTTEEADVGLFWMDSDACAPLCGAGTFAVGTVLVETGIVDPKLKSEITIDTPVGLITVSPKIVNDKVESVTTRMVPSFFYNHLTVDIPGIGKIPVDISFGGNLFEPIVDSRELGIELTMGNRYKIEGLGLMIRDMLNEEMSFKHPNFPNELSINKIKQVQFYDDKLTSSTSNCRCLCIVGPGVIDLTPSGTSTCAQIATRYATGKLGINEEFVMESIIGTTLKARIAEETKVGNYNAIIPEITGNCRIVRFSNIIS
ncbi:proline racemase family protein [Chloroflexota bacterium]